jgi:hypothetical protein
MMRDLVERFRYRLQLWFREQRGDFRCADGSRPQIPISRESIPQMIISSIGVWMCGIIILTGTGRIIATFVPAAAHRYS